jgi:hypothetical protein
VVRSQPGQIVHMTLSRKNPSQKRAGGVAQGEVPESKPQYPPPKKTQSLYTYERNYTAIGLNAIVSWG